MILVKYTVLLESASFNPSPVSEGRRKLPSAAAAARPTPGPLGARLVANRASGLHRPRKRLDDPFLASSARKQVCRFALCDLTWRTTLASEGSPDVVTANASFGRDGGA